jgi:hypothetical protein
MLKIDMAAMFIDNEKILKVIVESLIVINTKEK